MLKKKHKLLELKTSALVGNFFVWNNKTKYKWKWIEFNNFKDYDFSDNVKNIDFIKSEKEWKTLVRLFEENRELNIYFILDLNNSFYVNEKENIKMSTLYEVFYLIGLSAIKQWDKTWCLISYNWFEKILFAKKWKQNFINILKNIEWIEKIYFKQEWFIINIITKIKNLFNNNKNKKNNSEENKEIEKSKNKSKEKEKEKESILNYFNSLKIKKSLVFFLTDNLEIKNKELKILWIKNDFVVCNIFNSFENNLKWKGLKWFYNSNSNSNLTVDLDDNEKKQKYINLRKNKILNLKKKVLNNKWKYLLLDDTKNIYKEMCKLFK